MKVKMSDYAMDRLFDAVTRKGVVCVGLDTAPDYVPEAARTGASDAEAVLRYNEAVIDATIDVCACYKVQIAYYEAMGRAGLEVYSKTLATIRKLGGIAVADIKRGDIADTAALYAKAHFSGDFEADIVTLNPYMGMDSIEPWFEAALRLKKGAFVLLRTSNKGFADFEGQKIAVAQPPASQLPDTSHRAAGCRVYDLVGEKLLELAERAAGTNSYGIFGAVAGAEAKTGQERAEARRLRSVYKKLFFLIPGYGAQGGGGEEAALLLNRHGGGLNGGVVNASRSILKAWVSTPDAQNATLESAAQCARKAVIAMRDSIAACSPLSPLPKKI